MSTNSSLKSVMNMHLGPVKAFLKMLQNIAKKLYFPLLCKSKTAKQIIQMKFLNLFVY